jgi:hypothetical protein
MVKAIGFSTTIQIPFIKPFIKGPDEWLAFSIFRSSRDFKVELNHLPPITVKKMQRDIILYDDFEVQNVICRSSDDEYFLYLHS